MWQSIGGADLSRRWLAVIAAVTVVVLVPATGAAYLFDVAGLRTAVCLGPGENVAQFEVDDGTPVQGVLLGRGPAGVVLAHQSDQTLCDWLPFARHLAAEGFRAFPIALPFRPLQKAGWDRYVEAAVEYFRRTGAVSVVLIGASMGGAAVMVAAAETRPSVEGVVNLSGERSVSGLDADGAVRRSAVPLFIIASDSDRYLNARDASALYSESAATDKQLQLLPGSAHGTAILEGPQGPLVRDQIVGFVRLHSHRPG